MRITELEPSQRPRERLATHGAEALADRELLAILLGTGGAPSVGAHTLAEHLLGRFGSVAALARAPFSELTSFKGVGTAKASIIVAALELARRAEAQGPIRQIRSTADIVALVSPFLRARSRERLVVAVCDQGNRLLGCDIISDGAADRTIAPTREIVVAVLRRDGKAFALAHNHPSGDPTPSDEDLVATQRVRQAAETVGLRFIDHVIITDCAWQRVTVAH